jgi:hypothetical protein
MRPTKLLSLLVVLASLVSLPAHAAISVVWGDGYDGFDNTADTTDDAVDSTGKTHAVAFGCIDATTATITFTDSDSSTGWTYFTQTTQSGITCRMGYVTLASPGAGYTVTLNYTVNGTFRNVGYWLIDADNGTMVADANAQGSGATAPTADSADAGTLSTSGASVVSVLTIGIDGASTGNTESTGWTENDDQSENFGIRQVVAMRGPETTTPINPAYTLANTAIPWIALASSFREGTSTAVEQEGFRVGVDDGSESAHTFEAAQDTNVSLADTQSRLFRFLINGTGDPATAAYTLRSQKNGSGGYVAVPVGSTTENIGTTSYNALGGGSSATNTTTHDVSYPSMTAATAQTALYLTMTGRSDTATTEFVPPAGWTNVCSLEGGTGTWGTDAGTRRVAIWRKDTVTGSESGTITVTLAGNASNTIRGSIIRVEPSTQNHTIEQTCATGADTTSGTGYSATAGSNQTYLAGDLALIVTAQASDTVTVSAESLTATDVTFGTISNRVSQAITGGNDHRHLVYTVPVSSVTGTPNVAAVWAYTGSGAISGPTAFVRIRSLYNAPNEVYINTSANITAGGEATTARLTAPSGKTTGDFVTGRRWDNENGTDSIDITTDDYTEVEWLVALGSAPVSTDYFDFRVYAGSSALDTYTVTPRWTIPGGSAPLLLRRRR